MSYIDTISTLQLATAKFIQSTFDTTIESSTIVVNVIAKEIDGDYSVVLFPFLKRFSTTPEKLGNSLVEYLMANGIALQSHEIIKGFLNLTIDNTVWTQQLSSIVSLGENYGRKPRTNKVALVEFCSPNTNKPLHLGHIRNILIGWSVSQILEFAGDSVKKVQIINDRGIAICKSMVAWQEYGGGSTPQSTNTKGDHFVGKYYVEFEQQFAAEYATWQQTPEGQQQLASEVKPEEEPNEYFKRYKNTYFNTLSSLGAKARAMLQAWEEGDKATLDLWTTMNAWVYDGFDVTYDALNINFDKIYYESETYLLGKKNVEEGLAQGLFYQKEDGSIWADLENQGLDHKILLRSDGTSVYITQDIGTAMLRYDDFQFDKHMYVVADEQDYHFQALFAVMRRLGVPFADQLNHLSYGMVELPTGRMKSREGKVVDADDLVAEVIEEASQSALESSNIQELSAEEQAEVCRQIGLGALKYFMLRVQAKRRMVFDPSQSVDMQGQTGPYIQNAYVRIQSILARVEDSLSLDPSYIWQQQEKVLLMLLDQFGATITEAARSLDPSTIAHYAYELAKEYHKFYHDHRILKAESEAAKTNRLILSRQVATILQTSMRLLGIDMPNRM